MEGGNMKKLISVTTLFLVFLSLGQIRLLNDIVSEDDELFLHINVNNQNTFDVENVKVRALILGVDWDFQTSTYDEIDGRSTASSIFIWDVSNVDKGEYWIRVSASDDEGRNTRRYVPFYII